MEMMYNNFMITNLINITEVKRDSVAEREVSVLDITGRNGKVFQNSFLGTRQIEVSFYMKYEHIPTQVNASSQYQKVVRSLAYYLTGNKSPAKLIFSDEPSVHYLALVTGFDVSRVLRLGQGTITFECYTPYALSNNEYEFNESNNLITIDNDGTASTYPRFETMLSKQSTYLTFVSSKGVVQVGNPNGIITDGAEGVASNPLSYSDTCANTSAWTTGSQTLLWQDRIADGSVGIYSDGLGIRPSTTPVSEADSKMYQGLFMMTELPKALDYWQVKLYFNMHSKVNGQGTGYPDRMGMIEFYLFDENNIPLTNFSMRDYYPTYQHNVPQWYSGQRRLLWKDESTVGNVATQTYNATVDSLDELPTGATIIADTVVKKYRATINFNGTDIWSYPDTSRGKVLTKGAKGNEYPIKETNASWTSIWLNSSKTSVGYVRTSGITVSDDGTEISVVYKLPVDSSSGSGWNNFAGCVILDKLKNDLGGNEWKMSLFNKDGTNAWGGKIQHKTDFTVIDGSGTAITSGGKLKRIGVFIGSYNGATLPDFIRFDDLVVTEYIGGSLTDDSGEGEEATPKYAYIGNHGDVITVDCGEQMVYKNNEPFMDFVDVGSKFFDIDAFSSSEVRVLSDDEDCTTKAFITKRYL